MNTITCVDCGATVEGARQKRRCAPCRKLRARTTTRTLSPGEKIPTGTPRRYLRNHGYIELRWTVAPMSQVRAYEHQIVNGHMTTADQVHHRNHQRDDNRAENLKPMSHAEHHAEHRGEWWEKAANLYADGMGTYRIAKIVGADPSTVFRALVKMGVPTREQRGGRWHRRK